MPDIEDANAARQATGLGRAQDLLARAAMTQSIIDSITAPSEPAEAFDTMEVMGLRAVLANETAMRDHHATLAKIHSATATMYEERMLRVSDEIAKRLGTTTETEGAP